MRFSNTTLLVITLLLFSSHIAAGEGALSSLLLDQWEQDFDRTPNNNLVINAVTNNDLKSLTLNRTKLVDHDKLFSLTLKTGSITNQQSSGRCWLFAGSNVFSPKVMTKLDLSEFELSEPYLTFYDKLEKANFFLERIIELRDRPINDRSLLLELDYVFGDGGWWQYFTGLAKKYGVVPISAMPETKQSASTGNLNNLGTTLLRGFAAEFRQMHAKGKPEKDLRKRKEAMMSEIYRLLVYTYGKPPHEFTFRYETDKDTTKTSKAIVEKTYTPQSFFEEFYAAEMPEYVAICNNPALALNELYQLEASRNIFELPDMTVLNLPIEKLKEYGLKSLLDSQAVWFACDVGQEIYRDSGIMKLDIHDYQSALGIDFKMTKAERIQYKAISPNHAMVFTGVDTSAVGLAVKWQVENSWGKKAGDNGFFYMYDDWFSEYVLLVVVDRKLLSDSDSQMFDQKPVKVADWDPFFSSLRNIQ